MDVAARLLCMQHTNFEGGRYSHEGRGEESPLGPKAKRWLKKNLIIEHIHTFYILHVHVHPGSNYSCKQGRVE